MKDSEVINKMKPTLFENGWTQGTLEDLNGHICILGSLRKVLFGDANQSIWGFDNQGILRFGEKRDQYKNIEHLLDSCVDRSISGVADWNDEKGRTFDEVIDFLDGAEKKALIREEANG